MLKRIYAITVLLLCALSANADMPTLDVPDTLAKALEPGQFVLDEIMVTTYGPERTRVICKSEVERLSIDGRQRSLEDVVFEELLFQETIRFKVPMDDSVIDKYISSLRKEHNMTLDDIKGIFKNSGYSYEEGREQLRLMYAGNAMLEHKVASRLIVPRDDIIKFYNDNPQTKEAKYLIEIAFVPFNKDDTLTKQQTALSDKVKKGATSQLDWGDPIALKESEIAQGIAFVKNMKAGDVSEPQRVEKGFEVYRVKELVPERLVTLEKRYKEIEDELRAPRYNQLLAEYKNQVFKDATVIKFAAPAA